MKTYLVFLSCIYFLFNPHVNGNEVYSFNDGWKFYKTNSPSGQNDAGFCLASFDDSGWETVKIPHTSRIEPLVVNDLWQGTAYYRKTFDLSPDRKGKALFIQFEAAMNETEIWINGKNVFYHLGGYLPFCVNINDYVRFDAPNLIVVKLNNRDNAVTGPKPLKLLDFVTYGGIYRDVNLIVKEPVFITNPNHENKIAGGGVFFYADEISEEQATLHLKTHVRNQSEENVEIQLRHTVINKEGKTVLTFYSEKTGLNPGGDRELSAEEKMNNPSLWSPDNPYLYKIETELLANGNVTDKHEMKTGIRDIVITKDGLVLNGRKTFLRGVNRHQEYPYIGYALSNNAQYRDAYLIKQAGFDYVRASHYPPSPAFLDACDELGLFVLDAILGWQYFGDERFAAHALESSRRLIRRDRNHPCILAWELSINETDMPDDFMEKANAIAHEEYPVGNSYSAGWINKYYDIYIEARQHRHQTYLDRPFIVSEYGDWEYYAQNAGLNQQDWENLTPEEQNSRQERGAGEKRLLQQALNIQEAHNENLSTHAFADGYWIMFDYNRGYSHDLEFSGIMDIFRLPKYSYYFFQSQRSVDAENPFAAPVIFIASEWMPEISKGVKIFSNCDEVELFIDGVSVGKSLPHKRDFCDSLTHPPFYFDVDCKKSGTVEAVGYINGKKVCNHIIASPQKPEKIRLEMATAGKQPEFGKNDVLFIHAYLENPAGLPMSRSNNKIYVKVETGDAEIIGEASPEAEAGIAAVLLRIGDKPGKITIKAQSDNLPDAMLEIF